MSERTGIESEPSSNVFHWSRPFSIAETHSRSGKSRIQKSFTHKTQIARSDHRLRQASDGRLFSRRGQSDDPRRFLWRPGLRFSRRGG